jgi:hypothetical protein
MRRKEGSFRFLEIVGKAPLLKALVGLGVSAYKDKKME